MRLAHRLSTKSAAASSARAYAVAIVLSGVLLVIGLLVVIIGSFSSNSAWLERALMLIWNAFMFVAGVALGGGGKEKGDGE